jgi:16S rRNA C967 or C1407 C5-methylase (RsmB/RsmF family)/NOL1/NOP2/fmu family ribosome biogenesis protein
VQVPQQLIESLKTVQGFEEAAFRHVHQSGAQVTSVRINPAKWTAEALAQQQAGVSPVPWSRYGSYLDQRPSFTFDPLFHAGCYYVQEASSMFLEQAVRQTTDLTQPLNVLDLCAAPGGKTTHLQSLLSQDSLLVSNEVIRSRAAVLKQNCIKWGTRNVVITNNDPQHFGRLEGFFDMVVVDAPCSGSGLFRRDEDAIREWSSDNVQLCCGRQKRILADVFPALKEGGVLIYSTCSYSKEENEAIADWKVTELQMENIPLHTERDWHIVETAADKTGAKGYRFFPDKVKGEGFFITAFRKTTPTRYIKWKEARLEKVDQREKKVVADWLNDDALELFQVPHLYGLLKNLVPRYAVVKGALNIQYAGVAIGTVIKEKLLPEHALALSKIVAAKVPAVEVDKETAVRYLQRSDLAIDTPTKGWNLVQYQGHNIGWINALSNRINNYYPKEFRILKQRQDIGFEK